MSDKGVDHVAKAAELIVKRGEEGELLNPHLEALEGQLFLNISEKGLNSSIGEATMSAFKNMMAMEILKTISAVCREFEIGN